MGKRTVVIAVPWTKGIDYVEDVLSYYSSMADVEPYKRYITPDELERMAQWMVDQNYADHPDDVLDPGIVGPEAYWNMWSERPLCRDDEGYYIWTTVYPNAKWDWYDINGSWTPSNEKSVDYINAEGHWLDNCDVVSLPKEPGTRRVSVAVWGES